MRRTCIIGGGKTGSKERLFPAALGGRRTSKGIYCGEHNGAYSGLAGIIATQLAFFNAMLGVVGDHTGEPVRATLVDEGTGQDVELSTGRIRFKEPVERASPSGVSGEITSLAFNTRREAEEWIAKQREGGLDVKVIGDIKRERYFLDSAKAELKFGGDAEGLRAIGYIGQTFFAHAFPDQVRLPEMQPFKDYTLEGKGAELVWWDFESSDETPNAFAFGHRVVVGLNADDNTAFCRISFFSTLNFAMIIARLPVTDSCAVVTDIDPLAKAPPNDIVVVRKSDAHGAVTQPVSATAGLAAAIASGGARQKIEALMRRIADFQNQAAATSIWKKFAASAGLSNAERSVLFSKVVEDEAQRVLNLMRYVADEADRQGANPVMVAFGTYLKDATKADPNSRSGLTPQAERSLSLSCAALARQFEEDFAAGQLDKDRIADLLSEGPGAAVVGRALSEKFMDDAGLQ